MLFDTHLHLIYKDRLSYPWLDDYAALNHDNGFDEYARLAARLGISHCFHMEVDVAEDQIEQEVAVISKLAGAHNGLLRGIISSCRPEHGGFAAHLDRARATGLVRGFRRVLHVVPDDVSTTQTFRDNIRRLSGTGMTFDLCVLPRQLPLAIDLVDHCPDVTFILDHCGVPDVASGALEPWRDHLRAVAERPNVHAKISGVIAYGDAATWTLEDIRPFVEETVDAFGTNRLVWGSDSPVCNLGGDLPTWVAVTHMLTQGWSEEERNALYYLNALDLWQLDA
ncbi:amidohydrolase [Roseobacter cerasinus]|uniref:Amidohydrolase n=1 Tax=Roseobacter cerasinus TaxID=2602289 RepID=A0A640VMB5_9RHOB|nr:amidohydrolase [Roseobacter cerasinus]GFE48917.1 amidohydrolase [Roseobacter cerasinus]